MLLLTDLRQRRHTWGGWLLCVLLALLPLRAWAETAMHLSPPAAPSVSSEAGVLPCHAAVTEHDEAAPDESAGGCTLCSLCHGSALCPGEPRTQHEADATTAPAAVPQGYGPPTLPLPERPPRA